MKRAKILLTLLAVASPAAHAAFDTFLCIPAPSTSGPQQIPGDSSDTAFRNCIEVASGADTAFLEDGGALARDLRFTQAVGASSVPLRRALVNGTVLTSSTFHFRKSGAMVATAAFWAIRLLDARVSSISHTFSAGDDVPFETVSLRPTRIETSWRKQNADGSLAPAVVTCWDIAAGTSSNGACS